MPTIPSHLQYYKDHSWVRVEGRRAVLGITDDAQQALGDLVYVTLPTVGLRVQPDQEIGELESTKAVAPLIAPLGGQITDVNVSLKDHPERINSDPYGEGWIAAIELDPDPDLHASMNSEAYAAFLADEAAPGQHAQATHTAS